MKTKPLTHPFPNDMSHTDPLTGAGKRKRQSMDTLRAAAYRKALLDLLFVQATTGKLLGDQTDPGAVSGAPDPAGPPMGPPPMPMAPPMNQGPMDPNMPPNLQGLM